MRRPIARAAAGTILCLVAGRALAGPELPKLTVGTIFPMTGAQTAFGKEAWRGIELALDVLRLKDPELAARIALVQGDDASTAKEAAAAAERLVDKERAQILIGSMTAGSTAAAAEVARKKGVPFLSPLAAQASLTPGAGLYKSCFDEGLAGAILAELAAGPLAAKQAAVLRDDTLASQTFATRFAQAYAAAGGKVTGQEVYDLASEDFTTALKKLEASGATVIVTPAPYQTAALMMQQAAKLNYKVRFLGGDGWDTPALGQAAGPAAVGSHYVAHFAVDDPAPATQEFAAAFKTKFGRPAGAVAALAYDALMVAADGFRRANSNGKSALTLALARTSGLSGATGELTLGDGAEYSKSGVIVEVTAAGAKFKSRIAPKPRLPAADAQAGAPATKGH